jgi:hypothetical protein
MGVFANLADRVVGALLYVTLMVIPWLQVQALCLIPLMLFILKLQRVSLGFSG